MDGDLKPLNLANSSMADTVARSRESSEIPRRGAVPACALTTPLPMSLRP